MGEAFDLILTPYLVVGRTWVSFVNNILSSALLHGYECFPFISRNVDAIVTKSQLCSSLFAH